ncbi:MAG TPA: hypothetical protein VLJ80_07320 [Solirubrobacteraceae bacterium]|nr:hypothetical protein [Solirubrobacteraceae bacterium]
MSDLPAPYSERDAAPFSPSGAIYFMNGYSDATITLRGSHEELFLAFRDENTSIAASAPRLYDKEALEAGLYVPVPPPLLAEAFYPHDTPDEYRRPTTLHLMQVVSMNMRAEDSSSRLLIGLPYAESYPELFYSAPNFDGTPRDASSYGVVQSLLEPEGAISPEEARAQFGYPARSFFGIFHIIETPAGNFFNKKPTQMELQPDRDGKLALKLPPIPFEYTLLNGPIPLYDVKNPNGEPVADVKVAHHNSKEEASGPTDEAWPWHRPDLAEIERRTVKDGTS